MLHRQEKSLVKMPLTSAAELASMLKDDGCDVQPIVEPRIADQVTCAEFVCRRRGAVVRASFGLLNADNEPAYIRVSTCRNLFWFWIRRRDRGLIHHVIDLAMKHGGWEGPPDKLRATPP
jgi:hypothetical protein